MKKSFYLLAVLFLMTACVNNQQQSDNQNIEEQETTTAVTPQEAVKQVYDEVFNAYNNLSEKEVSGVAFDRKFMSSRYLKLDSLVAIEDSKHPGEIGFRDYDHWVQAQDWGDLSYSIDSETQLSETESKVLITITNFNEKTPVELKMVKEDGTWKIDDIIARGDSEVEMMEEYLGR